MTFNIGRPGGTLVGGFKLNGTNYRILDGKVSHSFVFGNVKQYRSGRWERQRVLGKDRLKFVRISGEIETDEIKSSLEALRDNGVYAYHDGVFQLDGNDSTNKVVIINLEASYSNAPRAGYKRWEVEIELEEFDQTE